ncbi:MAG: hypothetical protein ACKPHU_28935, partial [Planctomycetaceae bacterium]
MNSEMHDSSLPPEPPAASASGDQSGRLVDSGAARIFPCQSCGADLTFHIGLQSLTCDFCGYQQQIQHSEDSVLEQDFAAMLQRLQQQRADRKRQTVGDAGDGGASAAAGAEQQQQEVRCESCGGNVEFRGTLTSTACPYCGVP